MDEVNNSVYKIIYNPANWIHKYEVWFSGIAPTVNAEGYLVDKFIVKKVEAYKTQERAEAAILYQQEIKAFKEMRL